MNEPIPADGGSWGYGSGLESYPLDRRSRWTRIEARVRRAAIYLCLFLIGYMIASMQSDMTTIGTVAHYGIFKAMRFGLRDELESVTKSLAQVEKHLPEIGNRTGDSCDGVRNLLIETRNRVARITKLYCLTSEEERALSLMVIQKTAEIDRLPDKNHGGRGEKQPARNASPAPKRKDQS